MLGLGHLARATLGSGPIVSNLPCAPTSPASMSVTVGTGSIYALETVDATAYGSLGTDTNQVVKQGLLTTAATLSCPAPLTSGQSIVYLIEAGYLDQDTGSLVLTYFNSTNPAMPFTGPSNSGSAQYTARQGICSVQAKAGTPATTGSQVAPAADSGYTGLYTVTVAYGATTITSGNIAQVSGAPFIATTLAGLPAFLLNPTNLGFTSGTNWYKEPSGLIIQFGTTTAAQASSTYTAFPIAFPTACFGIALGTLLTSASVPANIEGTLNGSTTTTGFYMVNTNSSGSYASNWVAFGK
jgi:hypothetical protein